MQQDFENVYVIAGEGTKKILQQLLDNEANAMQAMQVLVDKWKDFGASFSPFVESVTGSLKFSFASEKNLPPGWYGFTQQFGAGWPEYETDNSAEGRRLQTEISTQLQKIGVNKIFNDIARKSTDLENGRIYTPYSFEKIGDEFIIICPAIQNDKGKRSFAIPPECQVISYASYVQKKAASETEPLASRTIRTWTKPLQIP